MGSSRIKNTIRNTFYGVGYNYFNIVGQFLVRTLLIWKLGNEYVGLNSLFSSILSVLNMTELGVGSAMCYSLYKPIVEKDQNMINALVNLYRRLCKLIGGMILALGLILTPFVDRLIKGDTPVDVNIYILYLIFLFDTVISYFLFSYQTAVIDAFQRNDLQSKILFFSKSMMYIAQTLVVLVTCNYWYYIIIMPLSTILENIARAYLVARKFPDVCCKGEVPIEQKREIRKKVLALFGHRLNGTIINSADNIVISVFLGLGMVGIYSNYYYILVAVSAPFGAFYGAVRSSIGNSYIQESVEKNYDLFTNVMFAVRWISAWFSICLLCLYQPFITLWVGRKHLLDISTVSLLALMFYEWRIFECLTVFKDAAGLWWEDRLRPYIACIANLVVNIILVNIWGINGVVASTILTRVLISLPWITQVLFKAVFSRNAISFYLGYLKNFIISILVGIITFSLCGYVEMSFLGFVFKMIICICLPNACFLIIYGRRKEFRYYVELAKSRINAN